MTTAYTRAALGGVAGEGGMEVRNLGFIKRYLGMLSIVVDLHGLDVGSSNLAVRTLELGVAPLFETGPISLAGLSTASIGRGGVDLRRYLLRCVLLGLRLSGHGDCNCDQREKLGK